MKSRMQKRMRPLKNYDGRDRLSEMPDEVIVHILSCMPIVYAVRTMLLRRFGDLWTLVHTLKIDMLNFCHQFYLKRRLEEDENERMLVFVRNVLILHKRPSINRFHIHVMFRSSDEYDKASGEVKTWVRFALGRQAKELILCDTCEYFFANLSVRNFTSQSLVTLLLDSCNVETRVQVNLPSLKKLSIDNCNIHNDGLLRFICGCPSLQELEIKNPEGIDNLCFSAPNVDKLSLVISDSREGRKPLPVDCPNIRTLELDVYDGIDIVDISSVRDIYIENYPGYLYKDKLRATRKLFYGKLDGVEVFHLSQDVSYMFLDIVQHLNLLQYKWKRVVLGLWKFDKVCLVGIYHLMRSLRNLEELTIYTSIGFEVCSDLPLLEDSSTYATPQGPQLKTITMHGYGNTWKNQLRLVEFLLKGAAILDKLIIVTTKHRYPCWNAKPAEELEFVKLVSSFPRASTSARVLFA